MTLKQYEEEMINCSFEKSESLFQKHADNYEDDLLEFSYFPEDYFNFALKLLSDEKLYPKPGVWNFLLVLGTESHKLTPEHYNKLSENILKHYLNYLDEDLCLAVCDFIARNYSLSQAKAIFEKLEKIENNKADDMQGFVNDGKRIMLAEEERRLKKGVGGITK